MFWGDTRVQTTAKNIHVASVLLRRNERTKVIHGLDKFRRNECDFVQEAIYKHHMPPWYRRVLLTEGVNFVTVWHHQKMTPLQMHRFRFQMEFLKLEIQGIVYLVDPKTARAYTFDLDAPMHMGTIVWVGEQPGIEFRPDYQLAMEQKFAEHQARHGTAVVDAKPAD
jgi:hypothetical protein